MKPVILALPDCIYPRRPHLGPRSNVSTFVFVAVAVAVAVNPQPTTHSWSSVMAAMFRDFSFDPASPPAYDAYDAYEADRAAMNVSPTSKPSRRDFHLNRPPTPPCSMGDLASQLNQQSLRINTQVHDASYSGPLTPPSDDDCAIAVRHAPAAPRPTYSRVSASLLRMQRQSNSRMQCSASHVRDISRLVQMIEDEEQCTISELTWRASSPSAPATCRSSPVEGDEGINMEYDVPPQDVEPMADMPQWKTGDQRDSCTRVARTVRMRKRSGHRVEKRRSS
ncbi:hypothetical protein HBI25_129450 [Parastagonospora nodorum]|nr:hypothetical protein HBH52_197280 [Parastagonospora nodorum]KAH3977834.1 hypothetical protein HBH51_070110 [Parastagonospora nodorum]KAH4208577.1 hypothetical protein HBI95_092310 [Parastagonospora nodorum]KAH4233288.1 hypothetical protein HBI06_066050 [Parastagonospora nodorum]KAH4246461.1 hypothetical protein HBI05_049270 [Parastagonospora nodorum]